MRNLFWVILLTTIVVYGTMLFWSLPYLTKEANGLLVFDLRPGGYSFEEAKAFLAALTPDANAFYRSTQHSLDTVFPALSAISLGWASFLLAPKNWGNALKKLLVLIPIPGMIFDYVENVYVAALLKAGAQNITPQMVETASFYSRMKAISVTAAMSVMLVLIIMWFFGRRKSLAK